VASSTGSVFDIPLLERDGDAQLLLSFDAARELRLKGAPSRTEIFVTDMGLYSPVWTKQGAVSAASRIDIATQLATFVGTVIRREARTAASLDPAPKLLFTREDGGSSGREDKISDKELTGQPSIDDLSTSTIDFDALRRSMETVREAIASDFVIIGRTLCRRTLEPFYAVTLDGGQLGILICTDEIPKTMIAAFRIGRLSEARAFTEALLTEDMTIAHWDNGPSIKEGPCASSQFDDVGLTVAHAGRQTLRSFKTAHNSEYMMKQAVNRLMFETPLSHLAAARELNAIIDERNTFLLAADAERIAVILEDIVSFGEQTAFAPTKHWRGRHGFPLDLIVDMWNNQRIDIGLAPQPRRAI
jgi:hypothetical protein